MRIRDPGWKKFGSGINIPQHWQKFCGRCVTGAGSLRKYFPAAAGHFRKLLRPVPEFLSQFRGALHVQPVQQHLRQPQSAAFQADHHQRQKWYVLTTNHFGLRV